MRQCEVLINKVLAGLLTETDQGKYVFVYNDGYLADSRNVPLSLTMPLREEVYQSEHLFPVFFNMLSEGYNRELQSKLHHLDISDDFGIMLETCTYDTIGAITVKPIKK